MFGFDSSYEKKPEKTHGISEKEPVFVNVHGEDYWTDPELIAQSQDMEQLAKNLPTLNITYHGKGLLQRANVVIQEMLEKTKGSRASAPFMFNPYAQALGVRNDLAEALTVSAALHFILQRKQVVEDVLHKVGTLDAYLTTSLNTGTALRATDLKE